MNRGRRTLLAVAVVIIGAVQVAVPVATMFEARPSRFGWQMYSGLTVQPVVQTENAAGEVTPVDVEDIIATGRAEIYWADHMARALCADDVVAVTVVDRAGTTRVACP